MLTDSQSVTLSGFLVNTLETRELHDMQTNTTHTLVTGMDSGDVLRPETPL